MADQNGRGQVVVRPRDDTDLPQAASVLMVVHHADGYPVEGVANPEEWLSPAGLLGAWAAVIDGRVVGHVAVNRPSGEGAAELWTERSGANEGSIGVLARLFVLPEVRKQAVGERLVRAALDYAARNGLRLVLDVLTKDAAAIRLYERLGWQAIGRISHHFAGRQQEAVAYVSPDVT